MANYDKFTRSDMGLLPTVKEKRMRTVITLPSETSASIREGIHRNPASKGRWRIKKGHERV